MRLLKPNSTTHSENSPVCSVDDYPLEMKDIGAAIISLNGRYPEEGRAINHETKEILFVLEGTGKIVIEDEEFELKKECIAAIEPGERYYLEGDNMKSYVINTPEFDPSQHKYVS